MTSGTREAPDWEGHKAGRDPDFEVIANDGNDLDERINAYEHWLTTSQGLDISRLERYYGRVANSMKSAWEESEFVREFRAALQQKETQYRKHIGNDRSRLFKDDKPDVTLETKQYRDFLTKTMRKNVKHYRDQSTTAWCLPPGWYTDVRDIVRTQIAVMHIDGVDFLMDWLKELATKCAVHPDEADYKTGLEGYYAAHLEVYIDDVNVQLEGDDFDAGEASHKQRVDVWEEREVNSGSEGEKQPDYYPPVVRAYLEIQVRTQLQETIYQILHGFYEMQRVKNAPSVQVQAKWDYTSDHFGVTYLGHVLHYVEGMIVQARDKLKQIRENERFQTSREVRRGTRRD